MIGRDTLKYWIDSVKYGNKKIGNGKEAFWNDSLTISPDEQLGLVKRLYFKQHPFRASVQESVKKMMIVQNNSQLQLAYQVGIIPQANGQLVWVIGWIEENRHVYPFVLQFDAKAEMNGRALGEKLSKELMEDLGFAERGTAWKEVLSGTYDLDGELPVNPDGGLKSFGHPIGASGLRMLFECWTQLRGEAGPRQIKSVAAGKTKALTHNLGGAPGACVSFVSVVGTELDK